jgi:DNA-directed RNA polymerase subunit RPC12/RpoP
MIPLKICPNCLVCGKPVEDISEIDVPYHVECVLKNLEELHDKKEVDCPNPD